MPAKWDLCLGTCTHIPVYLEVWALEELCVPWCFSILCLKPNYLNILKLFQGFGKTCTTSFEVEGGHNFIYTLWIGQFLTYEIQNGVTTNKQLVTSLGQIKLPKQ